MSHTIRWTAEKIARRLRLIALLVYLRRHPLPPFRFMRLAGPEAPPPIDPAVDDRDWAELAPELTWGQPQMNFVLRASFRVPAGWDPTQPTALFLPIGQAPDFIHPEALVYIDGTPYAAVDRFHREILLPPQWRDFEEHALALHGYTGIWMSDQDGQSRAAPLRMGHPAVVQVHQPTRDFLITARVALETAESLDEHDPVRWQLLNALDGACRLLETREPLDERFYASVPAAHEKLRTKIVRAGPPHAATITATGHAHLDVAWLWTLREARHKAGRTFHTAIRLMEQFPEYHFTQSQPQLYDYVRRDYPELFATIQKRAAEGRWEPIGGMWVEADCNLSGPESLARQFLLGQSFLHEHFGQGAPVLWLPDVFGYAWNLPQLIKQAGLEYFFTVKIGWSQYNRLPYDTFWWQGLDGTRVLTHFSTTPEPGTYSSNGTYNADVSPRSALGTWRNFQQKEMQDDLLMSFGFGDGGGGPTREMLENLREMGDFPGVPRMRPGSVAGFFQRLEEASGDRLPTWNGELYLELHRGTYTSQARNTLANRRSEFLLHDAEFVAALAARLERNYSYPHQQLRQAWELVCLNQFHDIIPGSSIRAVYEESLRQYEAVAAIGQSVRDEALDLIAAHAGGDLVLVNPTTFKRNDPALWAGTLPPETGLRRVDGERVRVQKVDEGVLIEAGAVPPFSVTPLERTAGSTDLPRTSLKVTPYLLENEFVRVELDGNGDISRIYDRRREREVLPAGAVANQWQAFEDRPLEWDAWDVEIYYDDRMWLSEPAESVRVVEKGPVRATVEIRRRILSSSYVQRISLNHNSAQISVETAIEWRERHVLLKVAFPVDVLAPRATYEIQWGNVERPTHRNTSWDWARFETCAQKWVDLSEGEYGVSLLNDSKYGHDIRDSVMRVTLLRGSTHPDPEADLGQHRFTYALLPHEGGWGVDTIRAAYALNDPLLVRERSEPAGFPSPIPPLVTVEQPNVVVETVKEAEDGNGLIVRLYEAQRRRGPVTVQAGFPLASAEVTNLLEETGRSLVVEAGRRVQFALRPYQIVTMRLVPA